MHFATEKGFGLVRSKTGGAFRLRFGCEWGEARRKRRKTVGTPIWASSEARSCALAGLGRIDQGFDDPKLQGISTLPLTGASE
jgi:hypothetical protein